MVSKIKSRKFFVFIVWILLTTVVIIMGKEVTNILQYFFFISVIYIGGQGAIDFAEKIRK